MNLSKAIEYQNERIENKTVGLSKEYVYCHTFENDFDCSKCEECLLIEQDIIECLMKFGEKKQ